MSETPSLRPGRRPDPNVHAQWQQRLLRFEQANQNAADFCAAEGVSLPSFYAWKPRLRQPTPPAAEQPRLLPVQVRPAAGVELLLPNGPVLRLPPGCDLDFVRSLVAALGGEPC